MAEAGISEPQLPSVQTTVLPTQNLSPKLDTETRTSDNELLDCLDKNDQPQATATPPLPEEVGLQEDDDVQFVFSVPRRRRKRRKRLGSSQNESEPIQGVRVSADAQPASGSPRKGSPTPDQDSEPCQNQRVEGSASRSGSPPMLVSTTDSNPSTQYLFCDDMAESNISLPPQTYASTSGLVPWWSDQATPLLSSHDAQFNWIPIRRDNDLIRKRKWEEGPVGPRPYSGQSPQSLNTPEDSGLLSKVFDPGALRVVSFAEPRLWNALDSQTSVMDSSSFPAAIPSPNVDLNERNDCTVVSPKTSCSQPVNFQRKNGIDKQLWTNQSGSLGRQLSRNNTCQTGRKNQQSIQDPASLVPDRSVSPRTKIVQIPKTPDPSLTSIPRDFQITPSTQPFNRYSTTRIGLSKGGYPTGRLCPYIRHSRKKSSTTIQNATLSRCQQPQQNFTDVVRKPSLYKVPPWPSSEPTFSEPTFSTAQNLSNARPSQSGIDQRRNSADRNEVSDRGLPAHPTISNDSAHAFEKSSQTATVPITTSPSQSHSRPFKTGPSLDLNLQQGRKRSPNLIVDIAETCQQNFPFAAVAERHKQPIQKVFDTFSAIIQLPLLRHSIDNRRHGSLGRRRMKEFRDAKKAMEKARERERKSAMAGSKDTATPTGEVSRPGRKGKKGSGLLKAAILNSVKGKDASSS